MALFLSATALASARAFDPEELRRGIDVCSLRICEHPDDPQWHQRRGELFFFMGRAKDSVADFDRVVALKPEQDPYHWQRGISCYYAGDFARGRVQFERHRSVNPNDIENAAWHFFCVARAEGIAVARKSLLLIDPGKDERIPMREIYGLLSGDGTEESVPAEAERAPGARRRQALQFAHLYLGLWHEVNGRPERSLWHIRRSAGEFSMGNYMGAVARTHLLIRTGAAE